MEERRHWLNTCLFESDNGIVVVGYAGLFYGVVVATERDNAGPGEKNDDS